MKIIFSCYGGAHTSIVAAGIHLGYLPKEGKATYNEIIATPYFDQTETANIGIPIYMGQDRYNNEIYVIGMGSYRREGSQVVYQFINEIRGRCRGEAIIINSIALINLEIRVGGFLSRRLGLIELGRSLIIYGIRKKYIRFLQLVAEIDIELHNNEL